MPKALIFGVNGQDGFYLNQLLQQKGIEVTGVSRSNGNWMQGSVGDRSFVEQLIRSTKPDYIFHLAANSAVADELLFEHQSTIVNGSLYILESVYRYSSSSKVFITGSGLQFINTGKPISEKDEFIARDVYSLARIQAVYAARHYRSKGVRAYVGYLFHHDSPFRTAVHLNRKIVDAVKKIAAGESITLAIGDTTVEKEFGFAGDVARGIFHLVQQEDLQEACIGTGKAYTIQKWLDICFGTIGKKPGDYVQSGKDYIPDFKRLVSDPSALQATGWRAEMDIEELAKLMLSSPAHS